MPAAPNQSHPLSNQEILFTRQRHEADRMGLHWDYRMVLGDKAYSWATKKEMPEPGGSIILFEQPVHDRGYALSPVVEIPKGNYGAGKTILDWVRKAKVQGYETEPGKLVIHVPGGMGRESQRFLLKKLEDGKYGDTKGAWLFRNLGVKEIEKMSSEKFLPDLTPEQMEVLGVLRHRGSQYGEGTDKDNFFGVRASLDAWPDTWHNEQHPQGWYQWYKGWSAGKRTNDDERQIKRWISFKARHLAQLQKADPTLSDLSIQPKRRQALLNWGIAPGINVENEMAIKNKYLEKIAMGPISLGLIHAGGGHILQNLALKHALKTRALANHVSSGFKSGLKGVVDTSIKHKAVQFAAGAALPEVNALHAAAHKAGTLLQPHLDKMNLKQKAGLHMMLSGNAGLAIRKGLHKDPLVHEAWSTLRQTHGLPSIEHFARNVDAAAKHAPLLNNVLKRINKGSAAGDHFKPGKPHAGVGVLGSVASTVADPAMGAVNTVKSVAQSNTVKNTRIGNKFVEKVHDVLIKRPFEKGTKGSTKPGKIRSAINDAVLGPVNTQLKLLGDSVRIK